MPLKVEVLPFSAVETVHFLRAEEPFFHRVVFGEEFHKFAFKESVETGDIGAHSVGGHFVR